MSSPPPYFPESMELDGPELDMPSFISDGLPVDAAQVFGVTATIDFAAQRMSSSPPATSPVTTSHPPETQAFVSAATTSERVFTIPTAHFQPGVENNLPTFKYKYPEAGPTPPDVEDDKWNKIYTAADSRFYNRGGKNAAHSKKIRSSGATYTEGLDMLQKRRAGEADEALGVSSKKPAPKPPKPRPAPAPKVTKQEPPIAKFEAAPVGPILSISEQIKKNKAMAAAAAAANPSAIPAPGKPAAAMMSSPPPAAVPQALGPPKPKRSHHKKKGPSTSKPEGPSSVQRAGANARIREARDDESSGGDDTNDGGEYCICRGPDDHRMMINCEGGCDDWYHCECMDMSVDDARELLDRFICPKCKTDILFTTWKPMCRYNNIGNHCRKAAAVGANPPSKYCSPEHGRLFWEAIVEKLRQDQAPSMGGAVNRDEFAALISAAPSTAQFHALGQKPRLPGPESGDANNPRGLQYLEDEEKLKIEQIKHRRLTLEQEIGILGQQYKLCTMIRERRKLAIVHSNKDICGYDNRLAMNQAEFRNWEATEEGKIAFETGVLGPRTEETKPMGAHVLYPGQATPEQAEITVALRNICLSKQKKCKHYGWFDIHGNDYKYNMGLLRKEVARLESQEAGIIDDAETREATKDYYAHNTTEQLF